ncbi:MAG: hypothetical protein L0229_08705 [Blastocatellia bacterium]|nr:hypothetical protein [Blastocatellia bacterium]
MKILYKVNTFLILALGIVHVSLTPLFFDKFSQSALWFISGGLTAIFMSFLNFALMKDAGKERTVQILCHIANITGLIFATSMFAVDSLRASLAPQSYIVLFLFAFEPVAAFKYRSW